RAIRSGVETEAGEASKGVTAGSRGSGDPGEAVLPILASGQRGRRSAGSTGSTIAAVGRVAGRAILAGGARRPALPTGPTDEGGAEAQEPGLKTAVTFGSVCRPRLSVEAGDTILSWETNEAVGARGAVARDDLI